MATHVNTYFLPHFPVTEDKVTFTAGVTGLNEMIAYSLTDEGDGILLGSTIYGAFNGDLITKSKYNTLLPPFDIAKTIRCQLVYTAFGDVDQFSVNAIVKYETTLLEARKSGIKIRALLICNPHNPLGKCYPKETLEALCQFCGKYDIHLISDEIYALSVFKIEGEGTPFTSVLALDAEGFRTDQIHVLYGMSKVSCSFFERPQ